MLNEKKINKKFKVIAISVSWDRNICVRQEKIQVIALASYTNVYTL